METILHNFVYQIAWARKEPRANTEIMTLT